LEIEKLLKDLRIQSKGIESGGISITHNGAPGDLIAHGFVRNKEHRFASNLNFVDPAAQKIARLDATGVLLGHPANSPLPETSFFTPKLTVKNDSETSQTVTAKVRYTASGKLENRTVPAITLAPHEVRTIDLRLTPSLRNAPIEGGAVSVEHTGEPGSIIALLCSVDEAQGLAVDAPFFSRRDTSGEGGNHPFVLDEQTRSVVYLTNITDKATKVAVIVFHDGGLFTPELMTVAPGQTLTLDLWQMRDGQKKDVQGRVLSPNVSRGQVSWSPRGGGALIGRVVMLDKAGNTASNFSCPCCCTQEPYSFDMLPNPLGGSPGGTQQMTVMEWDQYNGTYNIGPYNVTNSCDYTSDNTSVVTVNSTGMLTFVNTGSTTVQMSMEYWHSEPISAEDCGLVQLTAYDSAQVATVRVTFQKADGTALPNPFRVGISAATLGGTTHDRKQGLQAVVVPASEANKVSLSVSSRLNKSGVNVNTTTGIITFNVVGTTKSDSRGDATITATYGDMMTTAPVSVVVPSKIATPHDTIGGGVVIENRVADATSPAALGLPSGKVALATFYMRFLTLTVHDQFDDSLGDVYLNAEVSELWEVDNQYHSINQPLSATGTYLDPVGRPIGTRIVDAGSSDANNWPSAAKIAAPSGCDAELSDIQVKVDGFSLNPAIVNRSITLCGDSSSTTAPPVQLNVLWPN
jgi:hypothetical protein